MIASLLLGLLAPLCPVAAVAASDPGPASRALIHQLSGRLKHARGDVYGYSVAISGSLALISAPGVKNNTGAVYVFVRAGSSWHHQVTLPNPRHAFGAFGSAIAVSTSPAGTYAIIGAPGTNEDSGAAYIYSLAGGRWHEVASFTDPTRPNYDYFGNSVAISGSTAVIGTTPYDSRNYAYIVTRTGSSWRIRTTLADPGGKNKDRFGSAVAVSGTTVIVGASAADHDGSGATYVYVRRPSGRWALQAKLADPDGHYAGGLGAAIAIAGSTAIIGAPDHGGGGVVYVYLRSGSHWQVQATLTEPRAARGHDFGHAVAISGNRSVIGDPYQTSFLCGGAYEFRRSRGRWSTAARVANPQPGCPHGEALGAAVAISGRTAVIGAPDQNYYAGEAYVVQVP